MKKILIILDIEKNMSSSHKEILSHFSNLGKNKEVNLLIFCETLTEDTQNKINRYNLKSVNVVEVENFKYQHPSIYLEKILEHIKINNSDLIVLRGNNFSRDISSILADKINGELVTEILETDFNEENLNLKKLVYGSKFYEVKTFKNEKVVVTVKGNIFKEIEGKVRENIIEKEILSLKNSLIEKMQEESIEKKEKNLSEANVIVAGGYGVKRKEDFELLYKLSEVLDGSVGGTRAAVDAGYIRRSKQIGQSGKSVAPKIIFNFGISGQMQYTAGFAEARTVVSINLDKKASIFEVSDIGIVGDLYKILPEMIRQFGVLEKE